MALFKYVAKDAEGNQLSGVVEAANDATAISLIKSKGLFVVSLTIKEQDSLLEKIKNIRGVPGSEKVSFTRQLATMIAAGLPIPKSLEVLAAQTVNPTMKLIVTDCLRDVEGGTPLSVSVSKYPHVFSPTYKSLLRAGEASGKLQDVLLKLASTMEAQQDFRSKFKAALVYPIIVT
ncbi:type II secretion system F family protein, partial [candidate division WWE3 bacterium]|nr:type II secretion system F family protein [candidate division WWE3 bacterium]